MTHYALTFVLSCLYAMEKPTIAPYWKDTLLVYLEGNKENPQAKAIVAALGKHGLKDTQRVVRVLQEIARHD